MKKSIRIGDGIAEFFGTHDGNLKYLESLLKVQVHVDGENNLTIDGEQILFSTDVQIMDVRFTLRFDGKFYGNKMTRNQWNQNRDRIESRVNGYFQKIISGKLPSYTERRYAPQL